MTACVVLDFETYYDAGYTLKKLTTEAYIRDPRFEAWGACLQDVSAGEGAWLTPSQLLQSETKARLEESVVICHHAQFDGLILSHHFNIRPRLLLCTMAMSKAVFGASVSHSLAALAARLDLPAKTVPYDDMKGVRPAQASDALRLAVAEGCAQDVRMTAECFKRLLPQLPKEELRVIDQTTRMFTEPRLVGDIPLLRQIQTEEWTRKNDLLVSLGVSERDLMSADTFCALLEREGVVIEYKETRSGETPAIAKTDAFMQELTADPSPRVSALAQARLDVKSTLTETRAGRLAGMAERGPLPVYLSYAGAHTLRWSAGDACNFQNMPRAGRLRSALRAPDGHKLVVADLAQIECRLLNWVAGDRELVTTMQERGGSAVYCAAASALFRREVTKADKDEYQVGKRLELGCGYGMGWRRFKSVVRGDGGDGSLDLPDDFCVEAVSSYRSRHPKVVEMWAHADGWLRDLAAGVSYKGEARPFRVADRKIFGPNGTWLVYDLQWDGCSRGWRRRTRHGWARIWGGGLVENIVQYFARLVLSQACLRIERRAGARPALLAHDEAVYVAPEASAAALLEIVLEELRRTPEWLPGCPLDAEGWIGDCYGKAQVETKELRK